MRASPNELAIARSVIYASLFDYPLKLDQVHGTLIESDLTPSAILATYGRSPMLQAMVEHRDGFFFPAGRDEIVAARRRREARSRAFLSRHRLLLRLVCALPYTRLVALSGSLAHLNLEGDGDLDLFIVTRGPHVWTVTVVILVLAKLLRRRRVVCANFVLADSHLALEQQDLFTANQVVHLKPLIGDDLFREFLAANPFVARFYPNFEAGPSRGLRPDGAVHRVKAALETLLEVPSRVVEAACRRAYLWHLRRRASSWRSPEQVRLQPDYLKLHTQSHRQEVLDRFDRALSDALERADETLEPAVAAVSAAGRR